MANVYSVKLYQGSLPGGFHTIYTVPAGYTVVIRSLQTFNGSPYYTAVQGPILYTVTTATPFFALGQGEARPMHWYNNDMHLVLQAADGIQSSVPSAEASTWATIISGYQLTLP